MHNKLALVYMVAGISSRFGGAIKQFAEVGQNGETLIECSINQALSSGFNEIIFIVGEKTKTPFMDKFGNEYKGIPVKYAFQRFDSNERDKPWGTVDAICSLIGVVDSPFVVCNGDDLYGKSAFETLANYLKNERWCASIGYPLFETLPESANNNRALFTLSGDFASDLNEHFGINKQNIEERGYKKDDLCSMNFFAFSPDILKYLNEYLTDFKNENKGNRTVECLLPNATGKLLRDGKIRMKIFTAKEKTIGITSPGDELKVREILKSSLH